MICQQVHSQAKFANSHFHALCMDLPTLGCKLLLKKCDLLKQFKKKLQIIWFLEEGKNNSCA